MTRERENEIIAKVVAGDVNAYAELVEEYQTRVYNLALKMLANDADAQDIAQEAFLKAYRALDMFRGESGFSSWMYRLTTNLCIDFLRKEKKNRTDSITVVRNDEPEEQEIPDLRYNPETELERQELRGAIRSALMELNPEYRQAVVMRELGGMSYAEIADELEIELGTVKSRIARARQKMRSFLINNGNFFDAAASEKVKGGDMRE